MFTSTRAPAVRRLAGTLYGYAFLDDLVLLYPVYALLFADTGLSNWQISSLFVIWSATGILLEAPSGAWADAFSRRLLLCLAPALGAAGFALWVLAPSYWAFALGFVLWGAKGALESGALEALVYEELDRVGAADAYARIQGRARSARVVAVLVATAAAGPVLHLGGYPAVGLASVLACLLTAAVAALFPEHRAPAAARPAPEPDTPAAAACAPAAAACAPAAAAHTPAAAASDRPGGVIQALRAGLAEARADPAVRHGVLLVPTVAAVWGALEEYTPLLIVGTGVAPATVPLLLLVIWAGVTVGGLLAGVGHRLTNRGLAVLLVGAAAAMAAGAVSGQPGGVLLVAAAFGAFQVADVVADARLQDRITGPARSTVTSLASLATDAATIAVYVAYAALSPLGHPLTFALLSAPYLLVALLLARRPATRSTPQDRGAGRCPDPAILLGVGVDRPDGPLDRT